MVLRKNPHITGSLGRVFIPKTTLNQGAGPSFQWSLAQGFKLVPMKLKWQDELTSKNRGSGALGGRLEPRGPWNPQPTVCSLQRLTWPRAKRLKLFGITYLVGKISRSTFISGFHSLSEKKFLSFGGWGPCLQYASGVCWGFLTFVYSQVTRYWSGICLFPNPWGVPKKQHGETRWVPCLTPISRL